MLKEMMTLWEPLSSN